jgi:hypothetical protein
MRAYLLATLVILAIAAGYVFLLQSANDRVEARCAAAGGQVLTRPGEISKCLRLAQQSDQLMTRPSSGPPYWAAIYFVWISAALAIAVHAWRCSQ